MAKIGEKRHAEHQLGPEDNTSAGSSAQTTPSSGLNIMFRPSPLSIAASNLATYTRPTPSSDSSTKAKTDNIFTLKFNKPQLSSPHSPKPLNFNGASSPILKRKLDNEEVATPTKRSNLFMECLEQAQSGGQSEDDIKEKEEGFVFGREIASRVTNAGKLSLSPSSPHSQEGMNKEDKLANENRESDSNLHSQSLTFGGIGGQTSPCLPEVETITGEEGERHILQVTCKLFAFDSAHRNWKERGRGELRLNDAPQSEGVYQSRLVMRASGSYRVLLNTHLWSQMTCDRASPQSVRITAQEPDKGFGIFLIKGALKDIQQLYTAVVRRLEALQRANKNSSKTEPANKGPLPNSNEEPLQVLPANSFDEDDSVLGDRPPIHSSPESSPERQPERLENPLSSHSIPLVATETKATPISCSAFTSPSNTVSFNTPATNSNPLISNVNKKHDDETTPSPN